LDYFLRIEPDEREGAERIEGDERKDPTDRKELDGLEKEREGLADRKELAVLREVPENEFGLKDISLDAEGLREKRERESEA